MQDFVCVCCNKGFRARLDHGKPRKYCSRACFAHNAVHIPCKRCGTVVRKRGADERYCSLACRKADTMDASKRTCQNCGVKFFDHASTRNTACCSNQCAAQVFGGVNSHAYKGGRYTDCEGYTVLRVGKNKYLREHRIVAAEAVGRPLLRREIVIHLDRNRGNNALENLYIFASIGEFRERSHLRLLPKVSNLSPMTYMRPSDRGQTIDVQQARSHEALRTPPVGPWHNGRRDWVENYQKMGKLCQTKGTPHPDDVALPLTPALNRR